MAVEKDLLAQYAEPDLTEPPADLMKRGGAYYSTLATQLLNAHYNDLGETHVVNVPHRGAVPGWPADWVLEMPCRVRRSGITPVPAEPLPPACFGLVRRSRLRAADRGGRSPRRPRRRLPGAAGQPARSRGDQAQAVLDDMLETSTGPTCPSFRQRRVA